MKPCRHLFFVGLLIFQIDISKTDKEISTQISVTGILKKKVVKDSNGVKLEIQLTQCQRVADEISIIDGPEKPGFPPRCPSGRIYIKGEPGEVGLKGDKGDTGAEGKDGKIGAPGLVGSKGEKGDIGVEGKEGKMGAPGLIGPPGEQGPPGTPGARGEKGDRGPDGREGMPGTPGVQGEKGDRGPEGKEGAPGTAGPKGDKGERGPEGKQGDRGPDGKEGAPGVAGSRGEKGARGADGTEGPPGTPGARGEKGDRGPDGREGMPGTPGVQGEKGDGGPEGKEGAHGTAGPKGDKGDRGADGKEGAPGVAGSRGEKGDRGPEGKERGKEIISTLPDVTAGTLASYNTTGLAGEETSSIELGRKDNPGNSCTDFDTTGIYYIYAASPFQIKCDQEGKTACLVLGDLDEETIHAESIPFKDIAFTKDDPDTLENLYNLDERQISHLLSISRGVSQSIRYHCLNTEVNPGPDKFLQLMLRNKQKAGVQGAVGAGDMYYTIREDTCSNATESDEEWNYTDIYLESNSTELLPVIGFYIRDIRDAYQKTYLELLSLCFYYA